MERNIRAVLTLRRRTFLNFERFKHHHHHAQHSTHQDGSVLLMSLVNRVSIARLKVLLASLIGEHP
jgi:hypothetical protein